MYAHYLYIANHESTIGLRMKEYFHLQYEMLNRKMQEAGVHPLLGYLLGGGAFVLLSEYAFHKTDFARYLMVLSCFALQYRLSGKNRTDFLLSIFGKKKNWIRISENLIVSIPFVIELCLKDSFLETSLLLAGSSILALVSFQSNSGFSLPTPFSKRPFEFCEGFRKTFLTIALAYALTMIAISVDNLYLGIFSMVLIFLTTFSYYTRPEKDYYVWIHREKPRTFLVRKILVGTRYILLLMTPVVAGLLAAYSNHYQLILLFLLIGILFLWTMVLAKYSAFPKEMNLPEVILMAFALFFPPVIVLIMAYFYRKSINNLQPILNDKN